MVHRELHVAVVAFHVHVDAGPLLLQIEQGLLDSLDACDIACHEFFVRFVGGRHLDSPSSGGADTTTRRRGRPAAAGRPASALAVAGSSTLAVWRRSTSPFTGSPFGMDGITTVLSGGVG